MFDHNQSAVSKPATLSLDYDKTDGQRITAQLLNSFENKTLRRAAQGGGLTSMAFALSACGGGSGGTTPTVNVSLSRDNAGTYSATSDNAAVSLNNTRVATLDVADSSTNSHILALTAEGAGTIEFDFADVNDVVTLADGSTMTGFTTVKVTGGTVDARAVDLSGVTTVELNSKMVVNASQLDGSLYVQSASGDGELEIIVATKAEADALTAMLQSGDLQLINITYDLVAAGGASITADELSSAETTGTSYVNAGNNNNNNDPDDASQLVTLNATGDYTVSSSYGNVALTTSGTTFTLTGTGKTGTGTTTGLTDIEVNGITLSFDADQLDAPPITGTGSVTVNALEDNADIDLSNVTVTGTRLANVTDDVTFTGNLGTFTTAVATAQTLTAAASVVTGKTINGAGNVAVTSVAASTDLSNITNTGTQTAAVSSNLTFVGDFGTFDVTVSNGNTLTVNADRIDELTVSGAGNVTVTDGTGGDDVTVTTTGTNSITLGAGNDDVNTGNGADTITTGAGNDTINAGGGNDSITGGAGNDSLVGGAGNDQFTVDAGDDTIADLSTGDIVDVANGATVTANNVSAFVATADTENLGSAAADFVINAAAGGSTINVDLAVADAAGEGFTINGGAGVDNITGSDEADVITGAGGADVIVAGTGDDVITGGDGLDHVTLAGGAERVVIGSTSTSTDIIEGFTSTTDDIDITTDLLNVADATITDAGDLAAAATVDAAIAVSAVATQYIFTNAAFDLDLTDVTDGAGTAVELAAITTAATAALNDTDTTNVDATFIAAETVLFVLHDADDSSSAIFAFNNADAADGNNTITAGELTLLAVVDANAVLVNGDILV